MKCTKVSYLWRILIVALILASLILPLIFVKTVHAAGNTYYVTKSGNDSNDGLSSANDHAWLTIQKAASTMSAGDTVIVSAGTYNEQITPANSGSAGNYITYRVATGASVIIDGTGIDLGADVLACWANGLVKIWNKEYLKFDGFEIYNADTDGADGITAYASVGNHTDYLEFRNLTIHKTGTSGIDFVTSWGSVYG